MEHINSGNLAMTDFFFFSAIGFGEYLKNLRLLSQLKLWKIELKVFIEGKNVENCRTFQKYGVDPANPKIDIVNGYTLPKEEANKLAESGKISTEADNSVSKMRYPTLSIPWNPRAVSGIINEYVFVATDSRHRPTEAITQDTQDALYRFENWVRDSANDMVIGWTHNMDNNGRAERSGPYNICTDTVDCGIDS